MDKGVVVPGDPYEWIANFIKEWIDKHPTIFHYEDYIVWVWTKNLEGDTVYLEYDGNRDRFVWLTDWYEGGECRMLGFAPISSFEECPEKFQVKESKNG